MVRHQIEHVNVIKTMISRPRIILIVTTMPSLLSGFSVQSGSLSEYSRSQRETLQFAAYCSRVAGRGEWLHTVDQVPSHVAEQHCAIMAEQYCANMTEQHCASMAARVRIKFNASACLVHTRHLTRSRS